MIKNRSFCICPLASGSKGNSLFISVNNCSILIDAGLSGIEIERRLKHIGIEPDKLSAIIITHEHSDHVKGAGILSRRFNIPVFITQKTFQACRNLGKIEQIEFFESGTTFTIDEISIKSFSISHDASDPVGLTLEHNGQKVGIATDLDIVQPCQRTFEKQQCIVS
jgi:phosphoribosyl 1,2-cyclic phosphodiesterase